VRGENIWEIEEIKKEQEIEKAAADAAAEAAKEQNEKGR